MELLKTLPEKSIDLCLTDPPYNIADTSKMTKSKGIIQPITNLEVWGGEFKDSWTTFEEYADWLIEISKLIDKSLKDDGSVIMFLDRKLTGYFIYRMEHEIGWIFKSKFYFEKLNPVPHIRKSNYLSSIEEAIWLVKKSNRYTINFISQEKMHPIWHLSDVEIQSYLQTFWQGYAGGGGKKISDHPTEKYSWMLYPLLRRHTTRGQTILDPFMGSGACGVLCRKMGLDFIGFERETKYFQSAKERVEKIIPFSSSDVRDIEVEDFD